MPSRKALYWNGTGIQELANPECLGLPVIPFASLPTLNSSDRSLAAVTGAPTGGSPLWMWNGSILTPVAPVAPVRSGIDLTIAVNQTALTTQSLATNTLRAFPWLVTSPLTLSAVRCEVSTLIASSTFRLALYNDNGLAFPSTLIANSDVAALDSSTTGVKTNTFASNITLVPGLYWLTANSNLAPTLRSIATGAILNVFGSNPAGGTTTYTGWSVTSTYGPMPATFPTAGAVFSTLPAPAAMFRTV